MKLHRAVAWSLLSTAAWLAAWLVACGSSKSSGEARADAAPVADGLSDAMEATTGIGVITFS